MIHNLKKGEDNFGYEIEFDSVNLKIIFTRKYNFVNGKYNGYEEEVKYKFLKPKERLKKLYVKNQNKKI